MNTQTLIKTSEYCALLSFLAGTAILIHYCFTDSSRTLTLGLYYIYIVGFLNLVVLALLLLKAKKGNPYRSKLLDAAKVVLLNLPVLFLYVGIVIVLLGYMRITFINSSSRPLENIIITGCQEKEIPVIASGASKTVWIAIPADCSIEMTYEHDGDMKEEIVLDYVSGLDGKRMEYEVGGGMGK